VSPIIGWRGEKGEVKNYCKLNGDSLLLLSLFFFFFCHVKVKIFSEREKKKEKSLSIDLIVFVTLEMSCYAQMNYAFDFYRLFI
jgi:hypothetical protein